jgi:ketosteroid isomerase-like protein
MLRVGLAWRLVWLALVVWAGEASVCAQARRGGETAAESRLTGVYRLNPARSDKLYSVVSGASSTLPFGEQQRFFIDLTARLTPPDQLAIERRGEQVRIASSRAPRTTFRADGGVRVERTADGNARVSALFEGESLVMISASDRRESYRVTFQPHPDGRGLIVTRRISSRELSQPVIIRSFYDKISEVAQWDIYGEPESGGSAVAAVVSSRGGDRLEQDRAEVLRRALSAWVEATVARDIGWQMSFYVPRLAAYYLTRGTPRERVRADKSQVFGAARIIEIEAAEPEIVFIESGSSAVMRFRKRYRIEGGRQARRGEVIQELRWRNTNDGWKIYSERDIRVIR